MSILFEFLFEVLFQVQDVSSGCLSSAAPFDDKAEAVRYLMFINTIALTTVPSLLEKNSVKNVASLPAIVVDVSSFRFPV